MRTHAIPFLASPLCSQVLSSCRWITASLMALLLGLSAPASADQIDIQIEIPALKVDPYHRPFVAAWIETPKRKGVATLTVMFDDAEWLKDLRQWWRKQGRRMKDVDAVSAATRKPGPHRIRWNASGLPDGEYMLCLEAAREAGGREFIRIPIQLGASEPQTHQAQGKNELGHITVQISPK
tara:strand:+ start:1393 stop:1935 length:543 start_codon:yes stop_codon:yes gene_type:complete